VIDVLGELILHQLSYEPGEVNQPQFSYGMMNQEC